MTQTQAINDWLEVADKNIANFTKSPFHDQLLTEKRAFYTEVFRNKERTLKALSALFHKAEKAKPFDLTMSRTQAPFGCWELGTQTSPHQVNSVLPTGRATGEEAYRFVFIVVNAQLLNSSDFVRHTCYNRKCLRPDHLTVGSYAENRQDDETRIYAGRGSMGQPTILTGSSLTGRGSWKKPKMSAVHLEARRKAGLSTADPTYGCRDAIRTSNQTAKRSVTRMSDKDPKQTRKKSLT